MPVKGEYLNNSQSLEVECCTQNCGPSSVLLCDFVSLTFLKKEMAYMLQKVRLSVSKDLSMDN